MSLSPGWWPPATYWPLRLSIIYWGIISEKWTLCTCLILPEDPSDKQVFLALVISDIVSIMTSAVIILHTPNMVWCSTLSRVLVSALIQQRITIFLICSSKWRNSWILYQTAISVVNGWLDVVQILFKNILDHNMLKSFSPLPDLLAINLKLKILAWEVSAKLVWKQLFDKF